MMMVVEHEIADYKRWKTVFDKSEDLRIEYGIGQGCLNRNVDKPNRICVVLDCESVDRAREFMRLPQLRHWMEEGGVVGEPEIAFYEHIEEVKLSTPATNRETGQFL